MFLLVKRMAKMPRVCSHPGERPHGLIVRRQHQTAMHKTLDLRDAALTPAGRNGAVTNLGNCLRGHGYTTPNDVAVVQRRKR